MKNCKCALCYWEKYMAILYQTLVQADNRSRLAASIARPIFSINNFITVYFFSKPQASFIRY